jgi:hypothetical protein
VNSTKRVAIFTPKGLRTGGPEAMHQLHRSLLDEGENSVLVPWPGMKHKKPVHEYSMYEPNWTTISRLRKSDIVIVPSDLGHLPFWYFFRISKKHIYIWMLAVDFSFEKKFKKYETKNYHLHPEWQLNRKRKKWIELISKFKNLDYSRYLKKILKIKLKVNVNNYLFQSVYARVIFRKNTNNYSGLMLTDYTNIKQTTNLSDSSFCSCSKNHIAYFPGKSKDLIKLILEINYKKDNCLHFIPIKNLSSDQVIFLLNRADLYLDMGYFPGKDRLPRESIILNCPVLLAKRGSARYYEDFQLEDRFLLDLTLLNPVSTFEVIIQTISFGKKSNLAAQQDFRNTVLRERNIFKAEVKKFISVINNFN